MGVEEALHRANYIDTLTHVLDTYRLKSKSGRETWPKISGPFLCLFESGELPLLWFRIPNKVRHKSDSKGNCEIWMGKIILQNKSIKNKSIRKKAAVSKLQPYPHNPFMPLAFKKSINIEDRVLNIHAIIFHSISHTNSL